MLVDPLAALTPADRGVAAALPGWGCVDEKLYHGTAPSTASGAPMEGAHG